MARPLRIEYEGAVYHITGCGNARQDIFLDDEDRFNFLTQPNGPSSTGEIQGYSWGGVASSSSAITPSEWKRRAIFSRVTAGEEEAPKFLTTDWILSQFHQDRNRAIQEYRKFVNAGYGIDVWDGLRGGVILETERFVEELKPLRQGMTPTRAIPRKERWCPGLS